MQHYLRTSFCFDAVTSVPVAIIESVMRQYLCVGAYAPSGKGYARVRCNRTLELQLLQNIKSCGLSVPRCRVSPQTLLRV